MVNVVPNFNNNTSALNEYKFQQKSKIQIQHNDFTKFPVHLLGNHCPQPKKDMEKN